MSIEAVLEETMRPGVDQSAQLDWDDVGARIEQRAQRRSRVQRVSVAGFLGVLGLLIVRTGYSRNVTASDLADQVDPPLIDRWPTTAEVIGASADAPSAAQMWLFGLVILGLPALFAWVMWFCAPDAMRQLTRVSRVGRGAIAVTSGLLASLAAAVSVLVLLGLFYNPAAALARSSLLTDTFAISTFGVGVWIAAFFVLVMVPTDGQPIRWSRSGWTWFLFFILYSFTINVGSFAIYQLRWDAIREVSPNRTPVRGLLAPLFSRDLQFEFEGSDVSAQYLLVMLGVVGVVLGLLVWQSWVVLRSAIGVDGQRWDRLSIGGVRAALSGKMLGVASIVAGAVLLVGFFGSTFILHDQLADELPIPTAELSRRVEVRRWSILTDRDSPLVTAFYREPTPGNEGTLEAMEQALRDSGYQRDRTVDPYEWSRPRADQYEADFLRVVDTEDGALRVEVTVFDTDGLLLSLPVTAGGLALIAAGLFSLRRRR
ncbi:MAG: hypothetical protein R8J94_13290 [Acidimicrobiia bacterium]|nr:hypothetical protein [Acidimicrobiia bacterium]